MSRSLERVIIGQSGLLQTKAQYVKSHRDEDLGGTKWVDTSSFKQLDCKNSSILKENLGAKESAKSFSDMVSLTVMVSNACTCLAASHQLVY